MTRTEAEHLLDAYKLTVDLYGDNEETVRALRAVILDAMTSTTYCPYITSPKPWPYPQVSCTTATGEVDA